MTIEQRPVALVIEDDEQIRRLVQFILEREGFVVEVAGDGKTAQACIDRLPPPAVVTLDVMLPQTDGFQLLARMRSKPAWEKLPIIVLTARSHEKDIVRALDGGATDYLVKPFKPDELRARVRRMVHR
ncbi:MAG TPA: response regulator [Burkholderiales bacterium]